MPFRRLFAALALGLLLIPGVHGQTDTPIFPVDEIRPGLKGVGRTVFEGDKVEEFQVEFLGVLKNALAPKHDVILARLSGGPLEKSGVMAGMSGSPVYVDGKLVGAVALSFPFAKEPLAGITPIEEMLQVVPQGATASAAQPTVARTFRIARTSTDSRDTGRLIPDESAGLPTPNSSSPGESDENPLVNLRLPLRLGGFSQQAIDAYAPMFRSLGLEPMQGGALSGSAAAEPEHSDLEPGSMISLLLVRGDLNVNVDCTVTYRQGSNLYACGHFVLAIGPAEFPFAPARVLATVPSLSSSFKLDAPGQVMGTIHQDRFSAIYGQVGDKGTGMIPVHIHLNSTLNKETDYNFELVQEAFLSPLLVNLSLISTLSGTERRVGPATLSLQGKIRLSGGKSIDLEDVFSSDANAAGPAAAAVAAQLGVLLGNDFPDLRVEGIDLSVVSLNEKRVATLEQVWSTKSEVHPGDHLEIAALLRLPSGQTITEEIPVTIPESVTEKSLSLVVGGGSNINMLQSRFTPLSSAFRDVQQLVRVLNRMRKNDRVYALLMSPQRSFMMQGDEYPSPPPSLVQTFLTDPAASSNVVFSGTSLVGDFETESSPYAIQGQRTLVLKVLSPAP